MTDKQKENLIRLLKASNPASRNLGKVLLEKSSLSEEDKRQIEKECAVAPWWRMLVKTVKPKVYNAGSKRKK